MPLLALTNISYAVGTRTLLDGVSLSIEPGERIGLVGRNGSGKSTLMRVAAGLLRQDTGQVALQRGKRVGYLKQDPDLDPTETLRGEAEAAFSDLHRLHKQLDAVFDQLSRTDDPGELDRLLKRQVALEHDMEAAGGHVVGHRIDAVLHGVGLTDAEFGVPVSGLSGGQKARLALAKLLLEEPDVLLLDEPTNHLDIAGREWLENYLVGECRGAVVLVSHDRRLLDRVVSRIVEIEQARLIDYPGNYSRFRELRARRRLTQLRAWENEQTKFRQEEAYIRKYKAGQRAKQARGRETRLERAKTESTLERPVELDTFRVAWPPAPRSGEIVASLSEATKTYPNPDGSERVLFRDLTLKIARGERWGIIGPNGAGKTTLVRAMLGEVPLTSGSVRLGSGVLPGYLRQQSDHTDPDLVVYQFLQQAIRRENPDRLLSEQAARDLAGAFLFSGPEQETRMGDLSGGERTRASLAALLASGKNLLILDEPTNHLDISSCERLEEALSPTSRKGGYDGTLILISHDRTLIDALCDHLVIFEGSGRVAVYPGRYSDWQASRVEPAVEARPQPPVSRPNPTRNRPAGPDREKSSNPLSWMSEERLEAEIERMTAELRELDVRLGEPEAYADPESCRQLLAKRDNLSSELESFESEWFRRLEGV